MAATDRVRFIGFWNLLFHHVYAFTVFSDDIVFCFLFFIEIFILLRWIVLYKFHILYIGRGVSGTKSLGIWVKLKRRLFGGKKN